MVAVVLIPEVVVVEEEVAVVVLRAAIALKVAIAAAVVVHANHTMNKPLCPLPLAWHWPVDLMKVPKGRAISNWPTR